LRNTIYSPFVCLFASGGALLPACRLHWLKTTARLRQPSLQLFHPQPQCANTPIPIPIPNPIARPAPKTTPEAEHSRTRQNPQRSTIGNPGIVDQNVDHARIRRCDDYAAILSGDSLLRGRFQVAGCLRALPHHLNCIHYVLRLVVVGISESCRPIKILVHLRVDCRKRCYRFDTWVPTLTVDLRRDLLR
jgi:hypothetical protein